MPIRNNHAVYNGSELFAPFGKAVAVVTSNVSTNDATLPIAVGIYVGGTGDIAAVVAGNDDSTPVIFAGAQVGSIIPGRFIRVATLNTTATLMVFLFGCKP